MAKIVLTDIAGGYDLSKINDNFQKIEDELNNKVLYRDPPVGEPNTVIKDIDLNGKNLINVGAIDVHNSMGIGGLDLATEVQKAADSATASANSAAASSNSASQAASTKTQTDAVLADFKNRYQGTKTAAPTVRTDGSALQYGDLYFKEDTVEPAKSRMQVYGPLGWADTASSINGTSKRQTFVVSTERKTFAITGGYDAGFVDVYQNGRKLVNGASNDVDVSSGTNVVLTTDANVGDVIDVVCYGSFTLANHYTKAETYTKTEVDTARNARIGDFGSVMFRNRIFNGDARIDQRNSGAAVTSNSATNPYTLDRWRSVAPTGVGSGHFSVQQNAGGVTPPARFTHYLGATSLAATVPGATHAYSLRYPIEGLIVADLAWGTVDAKEVTLSFLARSSLTGLHGGAMLNQANDRSYPFSFTINAANAWEYKTIIVPGDTVGVWKTDTSCGIDLFFNLGAGASASAAAGAWGNSSAKAPTGAVSVVSTNGATLYITGVQLEAGSVATPFERRPYGVELSLCQRYYQTLYSGGYRRYVQNVDRDNRPFPVMMRTTPTLTKTTTGASGLGADNTAAISNAVWTVDLQFTAGGNGSIDISTYAVTASAEI